MCGIAGIWYRGADGPVGADLARMLDALAHRGRDGSGVALYRGGGRPRIVKRADTPHALTAETGVAAARGTHGIGHVRMATETVVDADHAHPFVGATRGDLTLVHNGHITNADALRSRLVPSGIECETDNDSEVIAACVAMRLASSTDLEAALVATRGDLDGTFSCVVATAGEMGIIRDRFAAKPLVVAETDEWVAVTSEGRGLPSAAGWRRREAGAGEVRVWPR